MQLKYSQFLAGLRETQRFLSDNSASLGTINASGTRQELDAVTLQLDALGKKQGSTRDAGRGDRSDELRIARALRRQHMRPLVRIARAKLPSLAKLSSLTLPPLKGNSTALATRAGEMADTVQPHAQVFVAAGRPVDFLDRLRAAAQDLVQAVGDKAQRRTERVGATDALDKVVRNARHVVGVLDAFVREELDEQEPLLTEWRRASKPITTGSTRVTTAAPQEVPAA